MHNKECYVVWQTFYYCRCTTKEEGKLSITPSLTMQNNTNSNNKAVKNSYHCQNCYTTKDMVEG